MPASKSQVQSLEPGAEPRAKCRPQSQVQEPRARCMHQSQMQTKPRARCRLQSQVQTLVPSAEHKAKYRPQSQVNSPEPNEGPRASSLYDSYDRDGTGQKRFYWYSEAKSHTADNRIKPARLGVGEVEQPALPGAEAEG